MFVNFPRKLIVQEDIIKIYIAINKIQEFAHPPLS